MIDAVSKLLSAIAVVLAGLVGKWVGETTTLRASIQADLDIIAKMDNCYARGRLEAIVESNVERLCELLEEDARKPVLVADIIIGVLMVVGGMAAALSLYPSPWAWLALFFSVGGVTGIVDAMRGRPVFTEPPEPRPDPPWKRETSHQQ